MAPRFATPHEKVSMNLSLISSRVERDVWHNQRLARFNHPLLRSNIASFNHQVVTLHNTMVRETTYRGDIFLSSVIVGYSSVGLITNLASLVNLLMYESNPFLYQVLQPCSSKIIL